MRQRSERMSQRRLEAFVRVEAGEHDGLVADQSGGTIDRVRVAPLDLEIGLAAGHEEAPGLVEAVQPREVEKAPIHDVERTGLGQQLIEDVDLVHLADVDEGRDAAAQIEQRVQFDRPRRVSTSDSGLSCLAGSGPACATVVKAETGRELRWAGSLPGLLRAEHYFVIERIGTARLRFRHGEIFSGLLVPIVWPILRGNGRQVYEAMNVALKQRVERGAEGASV